MSESHEGGCLCGSVRYRVNAPLRDVTTCHCGECRKSHGSAGAYTASPDEHLELLSDDGLTWIESPASTTNAVRGFCAKWWDARADWEVPDGLPTSATGTSTTA